MTLIMLLVVNIMKVMTIIGRIIIERRIIIIIIMIIITIIIT